MVNSNEENFLKQIQAGRKIEATDDMPEEYRSAVVSLLGTYADGELSGAYSILEWATKAPTVQEKILVTQMIRDEMYHASIFYKCLEELGVNVENRTREFDRAYDSVYLNRKNQTINSGKRDALRNDAIQGIKILNFRAETWTELIMLNVCLDRFSYHLLADAANCSYAPLAKACQNITKDEVSHIHHGDDWVDRLAKNPDTRQEVQQALDDYFPSLMNQFGPMDTPAYKIARKWGLMVRNHNELREDFRREIKGMAKRAGLQMPLWVLPGNKKPGILTNHFLPKIKTKLFALLSR